VCVCWQIGVCVHLADPEEEEEAALVGEPPFGISPVRRVSFAKNTRTLRPQMAECNLWLGL